MPKHSFNDQDLSQSCEEYLSFTHRLEDQDDKPKDTQLASFMSKIKGVIDHVGVYNSVEQLHEQSQRSGCAVYRVYTTADKVALFKPVSVCKRLLKPEQK